MLKKTVTSASPPRLRQKREREKKKVILRREYKGGDRRNCILLKKVPYESTDCKKKCLTEIGDQAAGISALQPHTENPMVTIFHVTSQVNKNRIKYC